mgnify:FL=1
MTFGGWITFGVSTLSITVLFSWCLYRVLSAKSSEAESIDAEVFENGGKKRK